MVTYTQARDAIVAHLNSNWLAQYPTVPLFYENTETADLDNLDGLVRASVTFFDARQASIENSPLTRVDGLVEFEIVSKEGDGTRAGLTYFDFLVQLFKHKNLSGVQVATPKPGHKETVAGWHYQQLLVPFWFHE